MKGVLEKYLLIAMVDIEIFKTNINSRQTANKVLKELNKSFPDSIINFALDDCDKILRIEGTNFSVNKIIDAVTQLGYECEILE